MNSLQVYYKNKRITKAISFILVFLPLLAPYRFPGTSINFQVFTMVFFSLLLVVNGGLKHVIQFCPKFYLLFFVYALCTPIIGFFIYSDRGHFISSYIPIVTFTMAFLLFLPYVKLELVYKYYRVLIIICVSFFFFQEIMMALLGWKIIGLIPFLPLTYEEYTMSEYINMFVQYNRSSSLFLEPAHFSQYALGFLGLKLLLLSKRGKKIDFESIIVTIALLLSFSGTAYVLTFLLWAIYFFVMKINVIYKLIIGIIVFFSFGIVYSQFSETERGGYIVSRANSLAYGVDEVGHSEFVRIYRGWLVHESMPTAQKITGVGSSNVTCIIEHSPFMWAFGEYDRYVNNAQCLMMGYGYIGVAFFLLFLFALFPRSECAKYFVPLFIVLCFIESFWCNSIMLLYLVLASTKTSFVVPPKQATFNNISNIKCYNRNIT